MPLCVSVYVAASSTLAAEAFDANRTTSRLAKVLGFRERERAFTALREGRRERRARKTNSISAPATDAVLEDARRSRFVARDEEGSGSLAPRPFDGT